MVTTTYEEINLVTEKAECWTVVFMMASLVWVDLIKVRVEEETVYGSNKMGVMVGEYLRGTL